MKEEKVLLTILVGLTLLLLLTAFFMFRREKAREDGILVLNPGKEAIVLEESGYLSESGRKCLL